MERNIICIQLTKFHIREVMKERLWICELLFFLAFQLFPSLFLFLDFYIPILAEHLTIFVMQGCLGNDVLFGHMQECDVACL